MEVPIPVWTDGLQQGQPCPFAPHAVKYHNFLVCPGMRACPRRPGLTWKGGVDASLNPALPFLYGSGALDRACQCPPDLFWSLPTVWPPYSHATHCVPGPCAGDASGGDRQSRPSSSPKLLGLRSCQLPTQGLQAWPPAPQHLPACLPGGPPAPSRGLGFPAGASACTVPPGAPLPPSFLPPGHC